MIHLDGIRKAYRDGAERWEVLRGASLQVAEGEFVAVMGASGSGKSTLLNVIGGLDRAFEGRAEVLGLEPAKLDGRTLARFRNESIGFVFQAFNLVGPLRVLENVLLPAYFAKDGGGARAEEEALRALERVGLAGKERRLPAALSGGERQRVALARALYRRPRILLADEPTGSLDPTAAGGVIELLEELNQREKLTLVLVTHDDRVAERAARTLVLRDGILVEEGGR